MIEKEAMYKIPYGLYMLTTTDGEKQNGCIVNTVFQITSVNPMICVSMNKDNATHDAIKASGKFSAAILSEDTDPAVIGTFGFTEVGLPYPLTAKYHMNLCGIPTENIARNRKSEELTDYGRSCMQQMKLATDKIEKYLEV